MAVTRSTTRAASTPNPVKHPSSSQPNHSFPLRTPDGHYILVKGRRWRATDPLIPDEALRELKHYLAKGRSGIRGKKGDESDERVKLARKRTGLAKLGLGERGQPEWWNDSDEGRRKRWEGALEELKGLDRD